MEHFPSQSALALATGITATRYSRIERGYCDPREDEAKALAGALKQSVDFILTGKRARVAKAQKPKAKKTKKSAPPPKPAPLPAPSTVLASPPPPKGLAAAAAPAPASVPPPEPAPLAPSTVLVSPPQPKGLAAAAAAPAVPAPASAPAPAAVAPVAVAVAPAPAAGNAGTDLSDPASFTLMPPAGALLMGNRSPVEFRAQLQKHAAFATKVLHTSKVKPRVWVAWRDFNGEIQKLLRGEGPATEAVPTVAKIAPPPAIPRPEPIKPKPAGPQPTPVGPQTKPVGPQAKRSKLNKNVFGYFVDVAKESLPPEQIATLSAQASSAKVTQPDVGFMKHFKRIAEAFLPRAEFEKLEAEAARRAETRDLPVA